MFSCILSHWPPACLSVSEKMTACGGSGYSGWREKSGLSPEDAPKWREVQGGGSVCVGGLYLVGLLNVLSTA